MKISRWKASLLFRFPICFFFFFFFLAFDVTWKVKTWRRSPRASSVRVNPALDFFLSSFFLFFFRWRVSFFSFFSFFLFLRFRIPIGETWAPPLPCAAERTSKSKFGNINTDDSNWWNVRKKKEIASKSKSTAADNSTKKTRRNFPTALPTSSGRRWPYRRGWCCCCCWCCFCCCQAVTHSLCSRRSEEEEPPRAEDFSGRSATLHVFPSPHLACSVSITFRPISARYHHRFFFFPPNFLFVSFFFGFFFGSTDQPSFTEDSRP